MSKLSEFAQLITDPKTRDAGEMMFGAYKDYQRLSLEENTKRVNIQAEKEVAIAKIQAQKDLLKSYLEHTFGERRQVIQETFKTLDKALESNNMDVVSQAMESIQNIVKETPLKQVDKLLQLANNPNVEAIEFWL